MAEHNHRHIHRGESSYADPCDEEIERLQRCTRELELNDDHAYTDSEQTLDRDDYNPFGYPRHGYGRAYPEDPLRSIGMKDIPEKLKVKLVALKLRKHASLWWDHVKKQRLAARKSKVETWDKMKKLMRDKFLPENHRQDAFVTYHHLRQQSMSVEEFIHEFDKQRMRCDVDEPEEQTIARFLSNLKPEIADVVTLQPYWTCTDVCRLALKVEKQLQRGKPRTPFSRNTITPKPPVPTTDKNPSDIRTPTPHIPPTNKPPTCYKCQGKDVENEPKYDSENDYLKDTHNIEPQELVYADQGELLVIHRALASSSAPPQDDYPWLIPPTNKPPTCYKCQGKNDYLKDTHNIEPQELVYADQGELLVIHRALASSSAPPQDDYPWLRNNIFRTKVTAQGKVCSMIIDGGSCDNVVSKDMVDKLNLKAEDHPEPYQLTWLKRSNHVKVSKRCSVKFSIGQKYHDEVWCEVIPMDACHLLLGRPWQFDRKTRHDGFKNTYSFFKDGINITLAPLDTRRPTEGDTALFLNRSQFELATKTSQMVFAVVVEESNPPTHSSPTEVHPLLTEFRDVFPENIPAGLPPMRDIQHCVDFVPGAVIPNKPAYRLNPKEFAELQRQVGELLEKRLIREIMSPCAVPALLVPKHDASFRMCIDSRAVNKITVKYRFPIPRFDDLIDQLFGAHVFSKIDLRSGYHQTECGPGMNGKPHLKLVMDSTNGCMTKEQHLDHLRQVFAILREQKLYANVQKCHFFSPEVIFLGYVISGTSIRMDETKIHTITSWPTPKTINEIRSFHGLTSFYRRFIRNFSSVIAPVTECMKQGKFVWTEMAELAFNDLKVKVTQAPILALPNFNDVFQVECDASGIGIGGVLSQNNRPIAYFSEKLNDTRRRYSTYDREFYAIVRTLETWRHYLLPSEFVLYSDHESLKYIHGQHKLNPRHARWVKSLQAFSFVIKHKAGANNQVADALSRRHTLVCLLKVQVHGFQEWKDRGIWFFLKPNLHSTDQSTERRGKSPFEVVYGTNPLTPIDLLPQPMQRSGPPDGVERAEFFKDLHQHVHSRIEKQNNVYKRKVDVRKKRLVFKEGDLVWIHLRKERFPGGRFGKLNPRADGPFRVLKKINDNAYKIELPGHYNVSATFNVSDLSPYFDPDDGAFDSRSSLSEEGGDDADACGLNGPRIGPVTLDDYFADKVAGLKMWNQVG
ncbi:uncharacterized protein [Rutidosis leptorrhynchoides]|uniref:uncharacterized protein n=1 Tax=Rutidosis leptorrhynchoides TaxID=125765 RepID=UPI003A9A5A7A